MGLKLLLSPLVGCPWAATTKLIPISRHQEAKPRKLGAAEFTSTECLTQHILISQFLNPSTWISVRDAERTAISTTTTFLSATSTSGSASGSHSDSPCKSSPKSFRKKWFWATAISLPVSELFCPSYGCQNSRVHSTTTFGLSEIYQLRSASRQNIFGKDLDVLKMLYTALNARPTDLRVKLLAFTMLSYRKLVNEEENFSEVRQKRYLVLSLLKT